MASTSEREFLNVESPQEWLATLRGVHNAETPARVIWHPARKTVELRRARDDKLLRTWTNVEQVDYTGLELVLHIVTVHHERIVIDGPAP